MTDERGLRRRPVAEVIVELTTQQWKDEDTITDLRAEIDRLRAIVNAQKANGGIRRDRHRLYGEVHRLKWELHRAVTANAALRAVVEGLRTQLATSEQRWQEERDKRTVEAAAFVDAAQQLLDGNTSLTAQVDAVKALIGESVEAEGEGYCEQLPTIWVKDVRRALEGLG